MIKRWFGSRRPTLRDEVASLRQELALLRHDLSNSAPGISQMQEHVSQIQEQMGYLRHRAHQQGNDLEHLRRRTLEQMDSYATPLFDSILGKVTRAGLRMHIDGRDSGAGAEILGHGQLEPNVGRLLSKLVKPGGVFLDVGANFGYYALLGALLGGPRGKVFAFEANPYLIPLIERSIYVNSFKSRVTLIDKAVSDAPGSAALGFNYNFIGGGGLVSDHSNEANLQKVDVDLVRIDDCVPADVVADCIKIDVEGHEYHALKGMEKLLRRSPNVSLILEYFPVLLQGDEARIVEFLRGMGFSFWKITDQGFLEDMTPERLAAGENCYLCAARQRPRDRDICLSSEALSFPSAEQRRLTGNPGELLVQGPYWPLPAGAYEVFVEGDITGAVEMTTTHEFGIPMTSRIVTNRDHGVGMSFHNDVRYCAVVVRAAAPNTVLQLDQIRIRDNSWS